MGGQLHLEQEAWRRALDCFARCLSIVQALASDGSDGGGDGPGYGVSLAQQDVFGARADACHQASRYCAYNLGGPAAAAELGVGLAARAGDNSEVCFRSLRARTLFT